jgi:hypothetical protein
MLMLTRDLLKRLDKDSVTFLNHDPSPGSIRQRFRVRGKDEISLNRAEAIEEAMRAIEKVN